MVGSEQLLITTRMGGGTDRERAEGGELVVTSYCFRRTVYGTSTYRLSWGAGTHSKKRHKIWCCSIIIRNIIEL